jgi:hypothetical protein
VPTIPAQSVTIPALWLFVLGLLLTLGVLRMRLARLDVREDWNRLIRFHEALQRVEASGGRDGNARIELLALARALDDAVDAPAGRPGLAAVSRRFDAAGDTGVAVAAALRWSEELRRDVLAYDRALQERMKQTTRDTGRIGPVFLAGAGAVLLLPLYAARPLGIVRRLTTRRVESSLWFHAAVGVVLFIVLAGTAWAALRMGTVASRALAELR